MGFHSPVIRPYFLEGWPWGGPLRLPWLYYIYLLCIWFIFYGIFYLHMVKWLCYNNNLYMYTVPSFFGVLNDMTRHQNPKKKNLSIEYRWLHILRVNIANDRGLSCHIGHLRVDGIGKWQGSRQVMGKLKGWGGCNHATLNHLETTGLVERTVLVLWLVGKVLFHLSYEH